MDLYQPQEGQDPDFLYWTYIHDEYNLWYMMIMNDFSLGLTYSPYTQHILKKFSCIYILSKTHITYLGLFTSSKEKQSPQSLERSPYARRGK